MIKLEILYILSDLLDALLKIINTDTFVKDVVNISSNCEIKLRDLILLIKSILKSNSEVNFGSIKYRKNEIMHFKMSNSKIYDTIGWYPKMSIESGLKNMLGIN